MRQHLRIGLSVALATVGWQIPAAAQNGTFARVGMFADAPSQFIPPPLHPGATRLTPEALGDGVYALLATPATGTDNSGFIVGERGVLVIDAHINGAMAQQIIDRVREVTDKPILYVVNTNYHGDHTFGNYRFPASTQIVAHGRTAEHMRRFEAEQQVLLSTVRGDRAVFADVQLRLPDIVFDDYLRLDLGGRVVELYHFGPANTTGDTFVYEPETRTLWTGNVAVGAIPPMFEYGAATNLKTLSLLQATLDVRRVIPGHLTPQEPAVFTRHIGYLVQLLADVRRAIDAGKSVEEAVAAVPLYPELLPADAPHPLPPSCAASTR